MLTSKALMAKARSLRNRYHSMFAWSNLKMTTKAAIILVLATWLSAATIGLVSRASFQWLVVSQIDRELIDVAKDFHAVLSNESYPFDELRAGRWNRRVSIHPVYRHFLNLIDEDGKTLWSSISSPGTIEGVNRNDQAIQEVGGFRLVNRQLEFLMLDPSAPNEKRYIAKPATLQVGCPTDLVSLAMQELNGWILPLVGGLVLLVPPLAWLVARWLLAPLQNLAKQTDQIQVTEDGTIHRNGNRDEIDRLASTINGLLERTRSHVRSNEDWIANSAHQLRGPLAAIMSNVEVVSNRISDGKTGEMLEKVVIECNYLNKIVNQLLLLGEVSSENGSATKQPVAWERQVTQAMDLFEALASEKGIQIELTKCEPAVVNANPVHLRFIVQNLIENAIKYTESRGRIWVSLSSDTTKGTCRLEVKDTGIGISKADQQKIGNRFFRSNTGRNPATTPRGSGLGLSIVLNIVESLRGTFQLESELGQGTTITIDLPTDALSAESLKPIGSKGSWLKHNRI
ncbi:MAG: HAMP domain-containing histidine kinase [Planctomycetes bacterium]|nr:HAMP domain-containing histidine kinase [Planctomycetota bacterium]